MANQETQKVDNIIASRRAMLLGGGAALAAMAMTPKKAEAVATVSSYSDADILNFALNLEYLEANFYYVAAFGSTIDNPTAASQALGQPSTAIGIGAGTTASGTRATIGTGTAVPFTMPAVKAYAIETAIEEGKHVTFLRSQLGSAAVAQPAIDVSPTVFNTLANNAGVTSASLLTGGIFNPYGSDAAFLAGAFIFEDVGVTAYHGAAPLITQGTTGKAILAAAASILAVEAYHSGLIRASLFLNDPDGSKGYLAATQKIAQYRATGSLNQNKLANNNTVPANNPVTGFESPDDYGVYPTGATTTTPTYPVSGTTIAPTLGLVTLGTTTGQQSSNIADADPTTVIAFSRTTAEVLNIVTAKDAAGTPSAAGTKATGGFFPSGLNGTFV